MNIRTPIFTTLFVLAFLIQGCAGLGFLKISKPNELLGTDLKLKDGVIILPEANITVESHNQRGIIFLGPILPVIPIPGWTLGYSTWYAADDGDLREPKEFWITIKIETKEVELSFDPGLVVLKVDGQSYSPKEFIGPKEATVSYSDLECIPYSEGEPLRGPVPIYNFNCFEIIFDIPSPSPNQEMILSISGIKNGERDVLVPQIRFKKKYGMRFGFLVQ